MILHRSVMKFALGSNLVAKEIYLVAPFTIALKSAINTVNIKYVKYFCTVEPSKLYYTRFWHCNTIFTYIHT